MTKHMSLFLVGDLYLMMGRELENLDEVPAGNIVGKFSSTFLSHKLDSSYYSGTFFSPWFTQL